MIAIDYAQRLLIICATVLCCVGAKRLTDPDSHCTITLEYTGSLGNPTWVADSQSCVANPCPAGNACDKVKITDTATLVEWECQCPSGGGTSGCKGTVEKRKVGENWVWKLKCSDDSDCAGEPKVCDWKDMGTSPKSAKCSCQ